MEQKIANIGVVIPVYNEEKYLPSFLEQLFKELNKNKKISQIFFVDDGSSDRSSEILSAAKKKDRRITVLKHKKNQGKGAALRTGFSALKKTNCRAVIFIDADHQHKPSDFGKFIAKLENYPVVFGYRNLSGNSPFLRRLGNQIAKFIVKNLFHVERKDLLCGYMAFRKETFRYLKWHSDDYGVETEISTIIGKNRVLFKEINIENIYLDKNKGVNLFQAFLILLKIPKWYFLK